MKRILFLCALLSLVFSARSQDKPDKKLNRKLQELVKNFHGQVGIYVKNLKTGKSAAFNADTIFPTASMVKVPIMCGVTDKIEKDELNYNQRLVYRDSLMYDQAILGSFKDSSTISLGEVQMLSITTSDNTASLWLQKLAGTDYINNWLDKNGFVNTRVNSGAKGRELNRKIYGWGQTTPREMAGLLTLFRQRKAISPAASDYMYRVLTRIYWNDRALTQIPPYIQAASKQGFVSDAKSEVVLVNAPHGDYVFCIATKNQKDKGYTFANEGVALIRKLSALLWNYFEPKDTWQPAEGSRKYYE